MTLEDKQKLIRKIKKNRIAVSPACNNLVTYNKNAIHKIIPHRYPFLLINTIKKIDLKGKSIEVECNIDAKNPVFSGHFPGNPLYPGVLQIEMMGQAGLCLSHFIHKGNTTISNNDNSIEGLFTRVHNTGYIKPLLPGDQVHVLATLIEVDDLLGLVAAQIIKNEQICSHGILEFYFK